MYKRKRILPAPEYIIRRRQNSLSFIHNKGRMKFFRHILMGQHREKKKRNKKTLSYSGMEKVHDDI